MILFTLCVLGAVGAILRYGLLAGAQAVTSRLDALENAVPRNTRSLLLSARFLFLSRLFLRRFAGFLAIRGTPRAACATAPIPTMLPGGIQELGVLGGALLARTSTPSSPARSWTLTCRVPR
jgi:hypothetical protein